MRIDDGLRDADDEARVELTPLIDVVFQLLIFFMVTMNFVRNREYLLPIDLAEATMAETPNEGFKGMTITVLADDEVVIDGDEAVNDDVLTGRLRELHQRNANAVILLRGDEAASHGRVLKILDSVKAIGFDRVNMVVISAT